MATHTRTKAKRKLKPSNRGRVPYRFTAEEVLRMVEAEIITADVELWDGVIYQMVKGEMHNAIVTQVARVLRRVIPDGFHVREEKSCREGEHSLPEPDVMVCPGEPFDYIPDPPPLGKLALVIEVNHHTPRSDRITKPRRYAEVGVPVYWIIEVEARQVVVHNRPQGTGEDAGYADRTTYSRGQEIPVVIDGREVGRVAVSDLFPPTAPAPAEAPPAG
jgi:Uma2 family endonuclease